MWWLKSRKELIEANATLTVMLQDEKKRREALVTRYVDLRTQLEKVTTDLAKTIKEPQTIILIDKRRGKDA